MNKTLRNERETLITEINILRTSNESRVQQIRAETAAETDSLRQKLKEEGRAAAAATARATRLHDELENLRARTSDYKDIKAERDQLQAENASMQKELDELKARLARLQADFETARNEADEAMAELKDLHVQHDSVSSELRITKEDLADANAARDRVVIRAREEAAKQLGAAQSLWEKHTRDKLAALEEELEQMYLETISDLEERVEKLEGVNTRLRGDAQASAEEAEKQAAFASQLMGRLKEAEDAYNRAESEWAREKAAMEAALAREAAALAAKEDEFNDLMDVKVKLNAEIDHYRDILEDEESRFGVASPPRQLRGAREEGSAVVGSLAASFAGVKRVRDSVESAVSSASKAARSVISDAAEAAHDLAAGGDSSEHHSHAEHPELDAHGGHFLRSVGDKSPKGIPGVELALDLLADKVVIENRTAAEVSLQGWTLSSRDGRHIFTFPDECTLAPREMVTVWSGTEAKAAASKPGRNLVWTTRFVWRNQGDTAILRDDEGFQVSAVECIPASPAAAAHRAATAGFAGGMGPAAAAAAAAGIDEGEFGGCRVM